MSDRTNKYFVSLEDLANNPTVGKKWIAKPWLAEGTILYLVSGPKGGKTVWLFHLIKAIASGTDFLGNRTAQSPVVYLTEQFQDTLKEQLTQEGLISAKLPIDFMSWDMGYRTTWEEAVDIGRERAEEIGAKVMVIDTFPQYARFDGDSENHAGSMIKVMRPIDHLIATTKIGVILVHHSRKAGGAVAEAGRGSSALSGKADNIVHLYKPARAQNNKIRILDSTGRLGAPNTLKVWLTDGEYKVY